jgi:hypothetical protein
MEWLIAFLLFIGMVWLFSRERQRLKSRSEEEYQQDVDAAGKSLLGAGVLELQKLLQPETRPGVEYVIDEQKGMTEEKEKAGDHPKESWDTDKQR